LTLRARSLRQARAENPLKVFILGLDGATAGVLDPLMAEGKMPNLKALCTAGVRGSLLSTVPPTSPVAWSTFVTGKNPGKHGVYDFLEFAHNPLGGRVNSSRSIQGETIWEIATRAGKRVVVGGVPLTYPPRRDAGLLFGDFLTPPGVSDLCSDPLLLAELERSLGAYEPLCTAAYHRGNELEVLGRLRAFLDYHLAAIRFLIDRREWDLFCYNLMAVDRLHHELWHVFDESHPFRKGRDLREARAGLEAFFRAIDTAIGELRHRIGKDAAFFILSDHGNGSLTHYLNLNLWLLDEGYIRLRRGPGPLLKSWLFRRGKNPAWAYRRLARLGFADLVVGRLRGGQLGKLDRLADFLFLSRRDIDWSRTRAYAQGNYGQIFLNIAGRQPNGIVAPGADAEALASELTRKLFELRSPETGEALIGAAQRGKDIYHGPQSALAPDLRVELRDPRHHTIGLFDFSTHAVLSRAFSMSGDHRPEGVLYAAGKSILAGSTPRNARLCDIAPTILHFLGLPIPADMDGRLLAEVLDPAYHGEPVVARSANEGDGTGAAGGPPRSLTPGMTAEEEAAVRQRLESLGYL